MINVLLHTEEELCNRMNMKVNFYENNGKDYIFTEKC